MTTVNCFKSLLVTINLLILLIGLCCFAIGVATIVSTASEKKIAGNSVGSEGAFILLYGIAIVVFAFLGAIAACKQLKCFLILYATFMAFLFISLLGALLMGYAIDEEVNEYLVDSTKSYGNDTSITMAWDKLQKDLECCGVIKMDKNETKSNETRGYFVWDSHAYLNGSKVPESCCKNPDDLKEKESCLNVRDEAKIHSKDCYAALEENFKRIGCWYLTLGITIELLLLFAILLSLALVCARKSE